MKYKSAQNGSDRLSQFSNVIKLVQIAQYDEFRLRYQDIARPVVSQLLEVDLGEAHAGTWRRATSASFGWELHFSTHIHFVIVYSRYLQHLTDTDVCQELQTCYLCLAILSLESDQVLAYMAEGVMLNTCTQHDSNISAGYVEHPVLVILPEISRHQYNCNVPSYIQPFPQSSDAGGRGNWCFVVRLRTLTPTLVSADLETVIRQDENNANGSTRSRIHFLNVPSSQRRSCLPNLVKMSNSLEAKFVNIPTLPSICKYVFVSFAKKQPSGIVEKAIGGQARNGSDVATLAIAGIHPLIWPQTSCI